MSEPSTIVENVRTRMTNEDLLHIASNLLEQVVVLRAYWSIRKQFRQNISEHIEEMNCSPAFYQFAYKAIIEALFMYLSRMYDPNGNSITLGRIVNALRDRCIEDMHPDVKKYYISRGNKFRHRLKPVEEAFYESDVHKVKALFAAQGKEYRYTEVELSLEDEVKLLSKRLKAIRKDGIIDNLLEQRNKIIAHNDTTTNFNFQQVVENFPVEDHHIEILVEFATDCTQFAVELLKGFCRPVDYVNIDDWSITLQIVQESLKQTEKAVILPGEDDSPIGEPEECT